MKTQYLADDAEVRKQAINWVLGQVWSGLKQLFR